MPRPRKIKEETQKSDNQFVMDEGVLHSLEGARKELRAVMRSLYDFQDLRKRQANRLKRKVDGSEQDDNGTDTQMAPESIDDLENCWNQVNGVEKEFLKVLTRKIRLFPEWNMFLKDVKGIGPLLASVLICEIDIEEATTVSKIWQYAGMNPELVPGKRPGKERGTYVVTGEMIRGDRPAAGFILPYNKFLKTKMLGVLADCFIKAQSPYVKFYYDYKSRLENEDRVINGDPKGRKWNEPSEVPELDKDGNVKYKKKRNPETGKMEVTDEVVMKSTGMGIHRDKAAKRYMVKMFLRDYYTNVRKMYGLEVRPPYEEEYLNRKHHVS